MYKNILEYLENSASVYPEKKAFVDIETSCTFSELVRNAKCIGTAIAKETDTRRPVAVFMEKGVQSVTAFMGIVYAGCFYTMLDSKQPVTRLNHILETLQPQIIMADRNMEEQLKKLQYTGVVLYFQDSVGTSIEEMLLKDIREQTLDIDPLYTNFTSGSTGVPKGVVVSHRSVIDFIDCFTDIFDITSQDIIGNQAPFDFDVSVKDIYATLKTGATMEIIPRKMFSFPMELLDYLCDREVTTLIWAVSALCIITTLKGFRYKVPQKINKVIFSGEVMPIKHLNEWKKNIPDAMYANVYGPTEITCNCTYYIINREFEPGDILPIGHPFPNEKILLLDEDDKLIEAKSAGVNGELCVSGTALALGYYNNPEQTMRAFVQNPLNTKYLEFIYRTGDLAYYNELGELCFASRKDFQIKHMGHRIELGEIESAIETVAQVDRICCIYYKEKSKIIAFYEGIAEKKDILKEITSKLPGYMMPSLYRKVERMPITENGKINRKSLMEQYLEER